MTRDEIIKVYLQNEFNPNMLEHKGKVDIDTAFGKRACMLYTSDVLGIMAYIGVDNGVAYLAEFDSDGSKTTMRLTARTLFQTT